LTKEETRQKLIEGCRISREQYSIEKMVDNFYKGMISAINYS